MTIAAVGVARELVGQVRGRLLRRFAGTPMKWKHGKLTGLAIVTDLIAAYYLPVAVSHLHHDDSGRWTRFFEEAEEFSKTAEQRSGERLPQGDTILRMRFLCGGFADLIARILGARHPWDDSGAEIEIELLADTDLRGGRQEAILPVAGGLGENEPVNHRTRCPPFGRGALPNRAGRAPSITSGLYSRCLPAR